MAVAPLKTLELYSGIGGMHYALQRVAPSSQVVAAFDINDVANDVYAHNFQRRPWQGNIEKVPASVLDGHKADIWLMAPPCQPYTRRGLQKDSDDWRAASFLRLIALLPELQWPPRFLLLENVIGFESSRMRAHLAATLTASGYQLQEFLLSPLQLGIPYSRPRYYGIACRVPADGSAAFQLDSQPNELPFREPPSRLQAISLQQAESNGHATASTSFTATVGDFLVAEPGDDGRCPLRGVQQEANASEAVPPGEDNPVAAIPADQCRPSSSIEGAILEGDRRPKGGSVIAYGSSWIDANELEATHDRDGSETGGQDPDGSVVSSSLQNIAQTEESASRKSWARFMVPDAVCERWGYALDIVAPSSHRCNCFTRTYTRYSKGSGSVLATSSLASLRGVTALPGLHRGDLDILTVDISPLGPESCWAKPRKPDRVPCQPGSSLEGEANVMSGTPSERIAAETGRDRTEAGGHLPDRLSDPGEAPGGCALISEGCKSSSKVNDAEGVASSGKLLVGDGRQLTEASLAASLELTEWLKTLGLRYFTPREVANLHSFPPEFGFPGHVTLRQRYSLLGNSLSVAVVADLLTYMLPSEMQF